ncbi:MAG: formimidoylglutamate deiminase [Phycisphaerales bacterium]|nr:formimidoylglutamate deiminase [Phycisphaerales bacterium]
MSKRRIRADLTWTGSSFERDVIIAVDDGGMISALESTPSRDDEHLPDIALLPGFVNVHSHAFQRGLRGRGERFPEGAGSFWTWREAMYELVETMTAESIYAISRQAFEEMLAAGMTTVGEFHYLHHDASCDGFGFDDIILRAAADAGIRLVLLNTMYTTGGIGQPLGRGQRRFMVRTTDDYWRQYDRLASRLLGGTQSMGVVAHSIRAVPLADIVALHRESVRRGHVFHMHVEEQRQEIESCRASYGGTPMHTLLDALPIDQRFTAVHCTHTDPADMAAYAATGANVCLCPLTEGNLGDGLADVPGMLDSGARLCFGTDSNARLCAMEELRWMEYVQRLARERRGVIVDASGEVARALLRIGTRNGARALGIPAGRIEAGHVADVVAIDLTHPSLAGTSAPDLLDAIMLGTGNETIAGTCVGGRWVRPVRRNWQ